MKEKKIPILNKPLLMIKILFVNLIGHSIFAAIFVRKMFIVKDGFWPFTEDYGLFSNSHGLFFAKGGSWRFSAFMYQYDFLDLIFWTMMPITLYAAYYLFYLQPKAEKAKKSHKN